MADAPPTRPLMKTPAGLQPLIDDGVIDAVLRPLKSGKEASVYVVRCGDAIRCAKVYKDMGQRSFQNRAHESDRGPLAVGAGDVDRRRQPTFGVPELREQPPNPFEREVDGLRVQGKEARDQGIGRVHRPPIRPR